MKVYKDIEQIDIALPIASIGIFDGVHKAHQEILSRINQLAKANGGESVLITLWPHPRYILKKDDDKLQLLSSLEEKIKHLEKSGIDNLIILPFTRELAETPFDIFVKDVLVNKLKIKYLIVGYNHHFGKNREGNYEKLISLSKKHNFEIEKLAQYFVEEVKVSSSQIRNLINQGDIFEANKLLGYHFYLTGKVVKGSAIGRKIGFPTANIQIEDPFKIIPKEGVYAVNVEIDGLKHKGMLNIGFRPTINKNNLLSIETHIFNFDQNIYNKEITILFYKRIRDEQKFSDLEQLKNQLKKDSEKIQQQLD